MRDLLFALGNLLLALGHLAFLATQFLVLAQQPLVFPMQLLTARLGNESMPLCRCSLSPYGLSRAGTHSPYVSRFGKICPAKSTSPPELLSFLQNALSMKAYRKESFRFRTVRSSPNWPRTTHRQLKKTKTAGFFVPGGASPVQTFMRYAP
jgi:hypothetical protein